MKPPGWPGRVAHPEPAPAVRGFTTPLHASNTTPPTPYAQGGHTVTHRHWERNLCKVTQHGAGKGGTPQLHQLCPHCPQSPAHAHNCAGISCGCLGPEAVPSPLEGQRWRSWDAPGGRCSEQRAAAPGRPHPSALCIRGHRGWESWGSFPAPQTLQEVISELSRGIQTSQPEDTAAGDGLSAASGPPGSPVSSSPRTGAQRATAEGGRTDPVLGGDGLLTGPSTRAA